MHPIDEAKREARKAADDREAMCKQATKASLAAKRAQEHLREREIALISAQAVASAFDNRHQEQFAAWSRNEAEKPEVPPDRSAELAEVERAVELARNGVETAEREAEEALSAYARAINRAADCAVAVLVAMADDIAIQLNEARDRVLSSYDQLAALMTLQPKSARNGVVLSKSAEEALASVRALAEGRFPPHVQAAQVPYRDYWQALFTALTDEAKEEV